MSKILAVRDKIKKVTANQTAMTVAWVFWFTWELGWCIYGAIRGNTFTTIWHASIMWIWAMILLARRQIERNKWKNSQDYEELWRGAVSREVEWARQNERLIMERNSVKKQLLQALSMQVVDVKEETPYAAPNKVKLRTVSAENTTP